MVLPFLISCEAWLKEKEWLKTGLKMLQEDFAFPRDYLLPLPDTRLDGFLKRRALYSDVHCFSVKLLELLTVDKAIGDKRALVRPEASGFWSERSDRCTLGPPASDFASGAETFWSAGAPRARRTLTSGRRCGSSRPCRTAAL